MPRREGADLADAALAAARRGVLQGAWAAECCEREAQEADPEGAVPSASAEPQGAEPQGAEPQGQAAPAAEPVVEATA